MPAVEALFFVNMRGRANVSAIVSWKINHYGDGTYGRFYRVYAYQMTESGRLSENKVVAENGAMTGVDGCDAGRESRFPFKTAADVKRFWCVISK